MRTSGLPRRQESPTNVCFAVVTWRDTTTFSEAERAALALTEGVTRLSDSADPVPDAIWNQVTRYYKEPGLAALLLSIEHTSVYNRLNVVTRLVAASGRRSPVNY
jgi:alkylhydroperoxidase family enzyme